MIRGHRRSQAPSSSDEARGSRLVKTRSRHSPESARTIRVIDIVPDPARKAWQISLIEEGSQTLVELRLAARAPDGTVSLTNHRSLLHPESLRRVIDALLAAEINLEVAAPLLSLIGRAA